MSIGSTNLGVIQLGWWTFTLSGSLPTGSNTIGAVNQAGAWTVTANQGGAPWSQNITQFGGTNVSTGTGASGAGIPRVTVANDSVISSITNAVTVSQATAANLNATVTGTVTATQGGTWSVSINGQPISVNATLVGPLSPTGSLSVEATLQGIDLGPAEMAQALPVTLALDQPPILVDGSQVVQPVSGTVTMQQNAPLAVTGSLSTVPALPPNAAQETGGNLALLSQLIHIQLLMLHELRALRLQFANETTGGGYAPDVSDMLDPTAQLN